MTTALIQLRRWRRPPLVRHYGDELKLLPTRTLKVVAVGFAAVAAVLPFSVSDFVLTVAVIAAIYFIGALGINLLTGWAGQVSIGQASFMGLGAYTAAFLGGQREQSIFVWLPAAMLVGFLVGALIGPAALRLRGLYLAFITVAMVFVSLHVFLTWTSLTGGTNGLAVKLPAALGPVDFNALTVAGTSYTRAQAWFWLTVALAVVLGVLTKNVMRSRPGRAMQAIRDRDHAAAVVGVNLARYKVLAFALSGALGAAAGALYLGFIGYVHPEEWDLLLSLQFIAILVIGGTGTIYGMAFGALFVVGVPRLLEQFSEHLQIIDRLGLTVSQLNVIIFGALLIGFLIFEPLGLAAVWQRCRMYFTSWPFRY